MDTRMILAELNAERNRIEKAIAAITGLNHFGTTARRAAGTSAGQKRGRRRPMSAAARRKLSRLLKARWASGKMGKRRRRLRRGIRVSVFPLLDACSYFLLLVLIPNT
jgi:hypothetical protein